MLCDQKGDASLLCQLQHGIVRFLASYKYDTHNVHHFCCADHLRIEQNSQQYGLILYRGKYIAHHIGTAGGMYRVLQHILTA